MEQRGEAATGAGNRRGQRRHPWPLIAVLTWSGELMVKEGSLTAAMGTGARGTAARRR